MAKRRGNGEGSVRKRKDGRWEGRYTAGCDPETGRAISKNVLGKTQAEVLEKLKAAIKAAEGIDIKRSEQYTVAEWVQLWFDVYSKPNIRESTARYYNNFIRYNVVPKLGDIKLNKLTAMDIQKFYKENFGLGKYLHQSDKPVMNPNVLPFYAVFDNPLAYLDFINKAFERIPVHILQRGFFFYKAYPAMNVV